VVARPCEVRWEARRTIWIVCGPCAARGIGGKQSTPSDCLGGTGVVSTIDEREQRRAGATQSTGSSFEEGVKATKCFSFA
jgi:hypothetical protein